MNDKIDFVIPWVDGADPLWLEEKNKWQKIMNPDSNSNAENRYQSWDNLQFWFRAIEKFMPWFHKIYFITWGHVPEFLNLNHPKLQVVKHSDYIPKEYLPTFHVNTIEMNLHRIEGLSDNIIYFNDDTFPLCPISEDYYFRNNIPCDELIETPIIPVDIGKISNYTWNLCALNISIINRNFNKREVQKKNHDKWFCEAYEDLLERNKSCNYWNDFVGFRNPHVPVAFNKKTFFTVWQKETEILEKTCKNKFRSFECVNQWLIRYWRLCEGDFSPRITKGKSYTVTIDNYKEVAKIIENQAQQMICMNEDCTYDEFEIIKKHVNQAFELLLPEKSSFEK